MNRKTSWTLTLLSILVLGAVAWAAQALPAAGADDAPAGLAAEGNATPAPAPAPGDDPPPLSLDLPEPISQCLAGWCSSDSQCEEWYGPGSTCHRQKGATCGFCD